MFTFKKKLYTIYYNEIKCKKTKENEKERE